MLAASGCEQWQQGQAAAASLACSMHGFAWVTINEPNHALNGANQSLFGTVLKFCHASKHQDVKFECLKICSKRLGPKVLPFQKHLNTPLIAQVTIF